MKGWVRSAMAALLLGMLVSGCESAVESQSHAPPDPLTAPDFRRAVLENSLYRSGREWFRRWEYVGVHRPNGTMTGRVWWSGGEELAEGVWEVAEGDLYCRTWSNHWGDGRRGCFRVSRDGDTLVFDHISGARGDTERYTYRLIPANPHGL